MACPRDWSFTEPHVGDIRQIRALMHDPVALYFSRHGSSRNPHGDAEWAPCLPGLSGACALGTRYREGSLA